LFEIKNSLACQAALFLLPLKNFFDVAVLDNRNALVEIKKPLDNVGNGIEIDVPLGITPQRRQVKRTLVLGLSVTIAAIAIV
jgi:hypothetical protein